MNPRCLIPLAVLVVYATWSLPVLYLRGELLALTGGIRPGMTQQEVLRIAGKPKGVYTAEQMDSVYRGYHPVPLIQAEGDLWIYDVLMFRVIVHFDKAGKVRCTDMVYT
ncbi:MAG: hypothetical protein KatS3mg023_0164 [Armatimonadota bacterium]|nr:MAG: hypothetical protein KatS3mg023_0164 [Armatimonadota bacterium]